jgi:hypothetical protein
VSNDALPVTARLQDSYGASLWISGDGKPREWRIQDPRLTPCRKVRSPMLQFLRPRVNGERLPAELPAPGSAPLVRPVQETVVILIVVTLACLWLIAQGKHPVVALGVIAGIGLVTVEIVTRFSGASSVWLSRLASQSAQI